MMISSGSEKYLERQWGNDQKIYQGTLRAAQREAIAGPAYGTASTCNPMAGPLPDRYPETASSRPSGLQFR